MDVYSTASIDHGKNFSKQDTPHDLKCSHRQISTSSPIQTPTYETPMLTEIERSMPPHPGGSTVAGHQAAAMAYELTSKTPVTAESLSQIFQSSKATSLIEENSLGTFTSRCWRVELCSRKCGH